MLAEIENRHCVRAFTDEDVSDELVHDLIKAASLAPSAGNMQPWRFVIVRDKARRDALAEAAYGQGFVSEAPVVIVVCTAPGVSAQGYGLRGSELYCIQDSAAAAQNILLEATHKGLGACWVGAFDEGRVGEAVSCPVFLRPVAMVPVGWPKEKKNNRPRRASLDDIMYLETFEE